jgi:signal transduction histidine kinase/ActR/RegA family two-component response regulator
MRTAVPTPWLLAALTLVYFAAGKLGLSFATLHSSASAVWPPTGIALAAFLLFGNRAWPAIFVGAFLVNVTTAGSVLTSVGIGAGNPLEGMAGAFLVNRFAAGSACFERARDVFKFAALTAIAATPISATIGVGTLSLGGYARWEDFASIWLTWWLGDAAGALIVTPLLLLWWANPRSAFPRQQLVEAVLMLLVVVVVAAVCFAAPRLRDYPLAFLCVPPLAWIAFRFGPREIATAIVLLTTVAVVATETGLGPFVMSTRNESLLVLQAFMGMVAMTLLPMAALVREHRLAVTEAEAATRARDVFLAMLSHELRNPLQAIAASLHTLAQPAASPEDAERAVAIARRQCDQLARLLGDLLDVTRAVSGKVALELRSVRLDETVRRCVELVSDPARREGRTIAVDAEPVIVNADAVRLEQIVGNLLGNSLKFTAPAGTIRVAARTEDGKAVLRVCDDGIGIPAELLPKVFDLFTQGERALDRHEGGLGVGLTLVRTLAELHGGSVEAHSSGEGKGSEFVVRFPLAREASESPERPATSPRAVTAKRVLIIEDNTDARESLHAVLASDGYEVQAAPDGEVGIEMAERTRPEIVLVDIGLPRIDGYEVARRLRARQASLGVQWRLIALTGYAQPEDVRRAEEAGFDTHLVKPVHPAALQKAMEDGESRDCEHVRATARLGP